MLRIVGLSQVIDFLEMLPANSYKVIRSGVNEATKSIYAGLKKNTTTILRKRSSALYDSIGKDTQGVNLDNLRSSVWIGTPYAKVHEFGAIIKAKNKYLGVDGGPYLNIPLSEFNMNSSGLPKETAGEVFKSGGYIQKSKKGNWIVFSFDGKPMFVLKKSVTIPPRLGMFKLLNEAIPTLLMTIDRNIL